MMLFADMADNMMSEVAGAPLPLVERYLVKAAREWARRTKSYVGWPGAPVDATGHVDLTSWLGADKQLMGINWASTYPDTGLLEPSTAMQSARRGMLDGRTGTPVAFTFASDVVQVYPAPPEGDTIIFEVTLMPTPGATGVEDDFADLWADDIENLALSMLFAMPGKPWSSAPQADYRRALYENAIADAEMRAVSGGMRIPRNIKYGGF